MKWVVIGAYGAFLPVVIGAAVAAVEPRFGWLWFFRLWTLPVLPLSLVISVVRFNIFDIDRILSATASYNTLAVLLGAGALVAVPRIAEVVSTIIGIDPGTGEVVLSLLLVSAVVPAHSRLCPQIDRLFFKERYALDHGIAELFDYAAALLARGGKRRPTKAQSLLKDAQGTVEALGMAQLKERIEKLNGPR